VAAGTPYTLAARPKKTQYGSPRHAGSSIRHHSPLFPLVEPAVTPKLLTSELSCSPNKTIHDVSVQCAHNWRSKKKKIRGRRSLGTESLRRKSTAACWKGREPAAAGAARHGEAWRPCAQIAMRCSVWASDTAHTGDRATASGSVRGGRLEGEVVAIGVPAETARKKQPRPTCPPALPGCMRDSCVHRKLKFVLGMSRYRSQVPDGFRLPSSNSNALLLNKRKGLVKI